MLWLAVALIVVSVASFVVGFVLFANADRSPRRCTREDTTGVKRAASRVEWPDVFRRMPSSLGVLLDKNANRDDRLGGGRVIVCAGGGVGGVRRRFGVASRVLLGRV